MFGKTFIVAVAVALLLTTLVVPAVAAVPKAGDATPVQTMTWSAPGRSLFVFPLGRFQPNGGCESGGNCSMQ